MPYKIQYSPEASRKYPQVREHITVKWGRWVFIAILAAGVMWVRLRGIPDFLIPGDPNITKPAISTMIRNLENGVGIRDAVAAFCKEILNGTVY